MVIIRTTEHRIILHKWKGTSNEERSRATCCMYILFLLNILKWIFHGTKKSNWISSSSTSWGLYVRKRMNIYQHTYVLCRRRQITRVPSYCVIFNWFDVKARGGQISCHKIYREYLYYFLEMELPIRISVLDLKKSNQIKSNPKYSKIWFGFEKFFNSMIWFGFALIFVKNPNQTKSNKKKKKGLATCCL
jgi:hypothetical protein